MAEMASRTDRLIHRYLMLPARSPNNASSIFTIPFPNQFEIKSFNLLKTDGSGLNPYDCALLALVA